MPIIRPSHFPPWEAVLEEQQSSELPTDTSLISQRKLSQEMFTISKTQKQDTAIREGPRFLIYKGRATPKKEE